MSHLPGGGGSDDSGPASLAHSRGTQLGAPLSTLAPAPKSSKPGLGPRGSDLQCTAVEVVILAPQSCLLTTALWRRDPLPTAATPPLQHSMMLPFSWAQTIGYARHKPSQSQIGSLLMATTTPQNPVKVLAPALCRRQGFLRLHPPHSDM